MNVNIISGPRASGKTTKLRRIEQDLAACGEQVMFHAGTTTAAALRRMFAIAVARHYNALLFDDCPPEMLHRMRKIAREMGDVPLVVYAVEAA